jgi:predicted AlkP superfamily pyrophosphatase or phosphodiesterase
VKPRKLVLVVVDSLHPENLDRAVASGEAPTLAALCERGTLIDDCVSSFPTVTPVCTSEIATGVGPDRHWIPAMNWYHRTEQRYVEYGSSFEATRAFGVFRTMYDTVYNLNMGHLSHEVETVYERLGDAGVRSACTPFLIYRGRTRHELGLDGLLRRFAVAASFHHAVWGPDELFYGELYASRRVPCKPTLARPGTRDEYTACVGRELVAGDLYDFLLFSLPDHDYHSHKLGPANALGSLTEADAALGTLIEAAGGLDAFCEDHSLVLVSDHAQTAVSEPLPLAEILAAEWRVLQPNSESIAGAEIAVGPTSRAGGVYVLLEGRRRERALERIRRRLRGTDGIDLVAWLDGAEAVVARRGDELRFAPGSHHVDPRGDGWATDGDASVLGLADRDGQIASEDYPDALGRLWRALNCPNAGDVLVSLEEGWDCVDWGGASHAGGGSHGSLLRDDSLCPMLLVGWPEQVAERRAQWSLRDVAGLVAEHFEVETPEVAR